MEDCETNEERHLIENIQSLNVKEIEKPIYGETAKIPEKGKDLDIDLIWKAKKVMLFLDCNYDSYQLAQESGWKCYCTRKGFDVEEFINQIKE